MSSGEMALAITISGFLIACKAQTLPNEVAPPPSAPMSVAPSTVPNTSCLMVNVCACNLGCASIRLDPSSLREGAEATVVTGPLQGQTAKVVQVTDAAGARVFALSDREQNRPCSLPTTAPLLGYTCDAKKSGPVPANACVNGCE